MAAVDRSLVANLPMFAGLAPGEQDDLLREARSVRYTKGTAVFEQGFEADRFFVLLHGHLRVEKTTPQGQQTVVRYVSAGELFGVAQAMNLAHYPATAVAAVDSIALVWPSSSCSSSSFSILIDYFPVVVRYHSRSYAASPYMRRPGARSRTIMPHARGVAPARRDPPETRALCHQERRRVPRIAARAAGLPVCLCRCYLRPISRQPFTPSLRSARARSTCVHPSSAVAPPTCRRARTLRQLAATVRPTAASFVLPAFPPLMRRSILPPLCYFCDAT